MSEFLLEIGTEEIPASYILPATRNLEEKIKGFLEDKRIKFEEIKTFATPRRIAILVQGILERQEEWEIVVTGPPKKVAFDENGNPRKPLIAFAESRGVQTKDVFVVKTEKGEYIACKIKEGGKPSKELIESGLVEFINSIKFPKSMRWYDEFRFARPIRWILALFDSEVIEIEFADIKSDKITFGHKLLSKGKIIVNKPSLYEETLEKNFVIPNFQKRKDMLKQKLEAFAEEKGLKLVKDEELLNEVANLLEYPGVVLGKFDERYLDLPEQVVITAMKQHQRYFALKYPDGRLAPYFAAGINNLEKYSDIIRPGLERVLKARLEDAEFYAREDLKKSLKERIEELKYVVFREGLGSVYDKLKRMEKIAEYIARFNTPLDMNILKEGLWLSKTDLTTLMIRDGKEFTKLEGIIGMEYALRQGIQEKAARIIFEHHLPRFPGDMLPESKEAAIVGISDRIDTIVAILKTGYEMTGSQDPLGLRRLIYGLFEIIKKLAIRFNLKEAIRIAASSLEADEEVSERATGIILERLEFYLEEREGIRYDLVDCVINSGGLDLYNLMQRAHHLNELYKKDMDSFLKVAVGQKRVANILEKLEGEPVVKEDLFEKEEEKILYSKACKLEPRIKECIEKEDFRGALSLLMELKDPIDRFFDNVFVMTADRNIRHNRLSLLYYVRSIFNLYGDFSKIVIEGN